MHAYISEAKLRLIYLLHECMRAPSDGHRYYEEMRLIHCLFHIINIINIIIIIIIIVILSSLISSDSFSNSCGLVVYFHVILVD